MRHEPEGETVLSDSLDQAALHGVFVKIRDLYLYLISVNSVEAANLIDDTPHTREKV
jgi:hypothetical protein